MEVENVASSRKQPGDQQAMSRAVDDQHRPTVGSLAHQDAEHSGNHHAFSEHDTRTLRALQALTDTALSHLSLEALLPELLERVHAVMQVDNVAILLVDEATQELEVSAARGPEEELIGQVRIPLGVGFAGRIAA